MPNSGKKIPCVECGCLILPQTAAKYRGRCAQCGKAVQQAEAPPKGCVIMGTVILFGLYTGIWLVLDGPSSWLLEPVSLFVALVIALVVSFFAWAAMLPDESNPPRHAAAIAIEERSHAKSTPRASHDSDAPLPLYTKDPAEAVKLLFDRAVPNLPAMTTEQIEKAYQDCKWVWAADKLYTGGEAEIALLLKHNARRISRLRGFRNFKVFTVEDPNPGAMLYGMVDQRSGPSIFEPIGLWALGSTYYACGNSDFNDVYTGDMSLPSSDTAIFVFDYDQLDDSMFYGRDIAQAVRKALESSRGTCTFSDGDLEVAAGGVTKVAGLLESMGHAGWHVVPANENSPLNRLSEICDDGLLAYTDRIPAFASAMWTDTPKCVHTIHRNLSTSFSGPYLGVLIFARSAGSATAFFDEIRPLSLVPATTFRDGEIIPDANYYGI